MVLAGAACWGLSGTAAQVLFHAHGVSPAWLVTVRMLAAGGLLAVALRPPFPRSGRLRFLVFAVLGLAGVQFTYMAAIAATNAATATFLQYLAVPAIALWELARGRRRPTLLELLAAGLAVAGTALLVLASPGGGLGLHVTPLGLAYGILSAVTLAYYTLASVPLVAELGSWRLTTWALLVGGAAMALWAPPWAARPAGDPWAVAGLVAFVVLFGTLAGFGLFLASLRHVSATEAGIVATFEPVAAAVSAYAFLHVALLPWQYAGGALILLAVVLLRLRGGQEARAPDASGPRAETGASASARTETTAHAGETGR